MKFTFIRHGETDYNKRGLMTGRIDESLNAEGIKQAEEMTSQLSNDFDVLYTSHLKRAVTTAEIVNKKLNLPLIKTDLIIERDFGSLAGKSWAEISLEVGYDARKLDKEQKYDYRLYGGESSEELGIRLSSFINEVKSGKYNKPLVICHGGILRMLHARNGKELTHIKNAAVEEFDL